MSQVTTDNRVSSVNLTPQTMRTPTFTTTDVAVAIGRGAALASGAAGTIAVASVQIGAQAAALGAKATIVAGGAALSAGKVGAQLAQSALRAATPVASAAFTALQSWVQQARETQAQGVQLAAQQMAMQPLSRSAFEAAIAQTSTAAEAIQTIVQSPLRLSSEDLAPTAVTLQALAQSDDKQAITAFAGELAMRHQAVIQREVTAILRESAHAIGFSQITERPTEGYLMARLPGSQMVFRADVTLDCDGQVKVATDTDGFHGTACEETTAKIFAEARKRGLHIQEGDKKSKVRVSQQSRRGSLAPVSIRTRNA